MYIRKITLFAASAAERLLVLIRANDNLIFPFFPFFPSIFNVRQRNIKE